LLKGDFEKTEALEGFHPCETCDVLCQKACPMKAFPYGEYNRSNCLKQMSLDMKNEVPDGEMSENGRRNMVIKYFRACESSCPVGA
jgi:ferredoxin